MKIPELNIEVEDISEFNDEATIILPQHLNNAQGEKKNIGVAEMADAEKNRRSKAGTTVTA